MKLLNLSDEELLTIANPIWENLIEGTNIKNYSVLSRDFSKGMLKCIDEKEMERQWEESILLPVDQKREFLGCVRKEKAIIFRWKLNSAKGEILGELALGEENKKIKILGSILDSNDDHTFV